MNKNILFTILILCILFGTALPAKGYSSIESQEIILLFDRSLRSKAEDIIRFYPDIRAKLEDITGWKIDFRPVVILINDRETFLKSTGDENIAAFARPERNLIVIDYSGMQNHSFIQESLMEHELCHLLLHRYIHETNLPKWLDEGLAQWVSDGITDMLIRKKSPSIPSAMLSDRYINMRTLEKEFPRERNLLIISYDVSRSFVNFIIRKYGLKKMRDILESLKNGETIENSVLKVLSVTFEKLEMDWNNSLKNKHAWFGFLISNLYEILFFLAAVMVIVGFIKMAIRKRAYNRNENDESNYLEK